jgi:hypothetical protein
MKCVCTISRENLMTVSLFATGKGHAVLEVRNIRAAELTTSRAIAALVSELKEGLMRRGRLEHAGWQKQR